MGGGGMMVGPAQMAPQQAQPGGTAYSVQYLREILPLERGLVQTGLDKNGLKRRKPETVHGDYWVGNISLEKPVNSLDASKVQYRGRFDVDFDLGLVRFDDQVVRYNAGTKQFEPAVLHLECSFTVRHPDTSAQMRWSYTQATGATAGYGVEVVRRDELIWERYQRYAINTMLFVTWEQKTYENELNTQSQYYSAGRIAQYVTSAGASARYVGLQSINPDGAITQVTWEIGEAGCTTQAGRLFEPSPYVPPYKERRMMDLQRKQRRTAKDQRKQRDKEPGK